MIKFLTNDAYITASVKDGEGCVRVRGVLVDSRTSWATDDDVLDWVQRQPRPNSGKVQAFRRERSDGSFHLVPRLVFERDFDALHDDLIIEDLRRFTRAWRDRSVARAPRPEGFKHFDPVRLPPENAWLLIGDEASYLTPAVLADMCTDGEVGIYDNLWTAPKNGEAGDLVLFYFTEPRKAACFVARLASRPFWRTDIEVGADRTVDPRQWWAFTTPAIEIEPIPFGTLREAQNGHLLLKGRSGHYLSPNTIEALTFTAMNSAQQAHLDAVVRKPSGNPELLAKDALTFEQWKQIPSGLLPLEAKVSEYIVTPLHRLLGELPWQRWGFMNPQLVPEYRVPKGSVDFVIQVGQLPMVAVEVKLAVMRPASGIWADSPDFQQLKRYMDQLDVPGLLIDAHSILFVSSGADAPSHETVRAEASLDDLFRLADFVFGVAHQKFGGTGGIPGTPKNDAPMAPAQRRVARRG